MFFAWFENWREQPVFVKKVVKWMFVKVREKCDVKAYIIVFSYLFQKSSTHFSHLAVLRMAEKNVVRVRSKPKLCFHLIFKRTLLIFEWKLWVLSKIVSVRSKPSLFSFDFQKFSHVFQNHTSHIWAKTVSVRVRSKPHPAPLLPTPPCSMLEAQQTECEVVFRFSKSVFRIGLIWEIFSRF